MTIQERQEFLLKIYGKALEAGLCHNKKQFAEKLGIEQTGLYSAMNGSEKALTESLISKVRMWADLNELDDKSQPKKNGVLIPGPTVNLFTNLSETVRNLSETVYLQQKQIDDLINRNADSIKKIG